MDEYLLLNELVDSDDDVELDLDMVLDDDHFQGTSGLLEVMRYKLGIDCNVSFPESVEPNKTNKKDTTTDMKDNNGGLLCGIAPLYSENEFLQLFRVKHAVVDTLIIGLKAESRYELGSKTDLVAPEVQILSVLWFLGQETATLEEVHSRFGLESVHFQKILLRIIAFLCRAKNKEIYLPDKKEKRLSKKHFGKNHGFQGAIGCVDMLRIKVKSRITDASTDVSEKDDNVVAAQAVVNENAKFVDLYVTEKTSTATEVLLASPLYEALPTICAAGEYLIGGAAYPCLQHLLSPYPDTDNLTGGHIYFNLRLATSLQTADLAFTLLTQRFRKLFNLDPPSNFTATQIMTACCVVHNIADNDDFENVYEPPASNNVIDDNFVTKSQELQCQNMTGFTEGRSLRDRVCRELLQE